METPKEPWNFCETPEEKCTMNYCDENGCQNRKRNLVEPKKSKAATFILGQIDKAIEKSTLEQQIEKTETLYRKVAVSERLPLKSEFYFTYAKSGTKKTIWFMNEKFSYVSPSYSPDYWLEEIPDPTTQLQAKSLEEIRDAVAKNRGYENWETLNGSDLYDSDIDEVARMYALEQTAQLQADKAELLEALEEIEYKFRCENNSSDESKFLDEIESLIQKHKQ